MKKSIQDIKNFISKHKTIFIVLTIIKVAIKIGIIAYFICKASDANAQTANKLLREGNTAYKKQKYNVATESYSKALQKAPKDVRAYFNQGDALFQLNELDKAKDAFTTATRLSKNADIQAKCHYNIGNALYKQEKWEESAKSYKSSLKLNPKDQDAKYNLMMALSKIKKERKSGQDNKKDKDKQDKKQDKKDQNQDQKQDQKNGNNQQNQPQQGDKNEQPQQQGKQPQQGQLSNEEAQRLLDAISAEEGKVQQKVQKQKGQPKKVKVQKDW